eukprot:6184005-Pleurochrysis_carterae.AAC.1
MPGASDGPVSSSGSRFDTRVYPTFPLFKASFHYLNTYMAVVVCTGLSFSSSNVFFLASVERPLPWGNWFAQFSGHVRKLCRREGTERVRGESFYSFAEPASGAKPSKESNSDAECLSNQHHSGISDSRHGCGKYADSAGEYAYTIASD